MGVDVLLVYSSGDIKRRPIDRDKSRDKPNTRSMPMLDYYHENIHGYVVLILCCFGCGGNILSIIVLNQPHMKSPMNFLLTCLTGADGLGLAIYAVIKTYTSILESKSTRCHSEALETFIRTCKIISGMLLALNSWLASGIAASRFYIISRRAVTKSLSMCLAKKVALVALIWMLLEHTHYCILVKVVPYKNEGNNTCFKTGIRPWTNKAVYRFTTLFFSSVSSSLLIIFSILLICKLLKQSYVPKKLFKIETAAILKQRWKHFKLSTVALLCITLSSVLTESPIFINAIYSTIHPTEDLWFDSVFKHFWKILTILNAGVHVLFLSISIHFRETMKSVCQRKYHFLISRCLKQHRYNSMVVPNTHKVKSVTSTAISSKRKDQPNHTYMAELNSICHSELTVSDDSTLKSVCTTYKSPDPLRDSQIEFNDLASRRLSSLLSKYIGTKHSASKFKTSNTRLN